MLPNIVKTANKYAELALPVDFEVLVSEDDFESGKPVIPKAAQPRITRLLRYDALYEGRFEEFLGFDDLILRFNHFRSGAVWFADQMMSMPPEIEHDDHLTTPRFRESLLDAMHTLLVDYFRFGVGLLHLVDGSDDEDAIMLEAVAPGPIYWYPINETTQALVVKHGDTYEVTIDRGGGDIEVRNFKADAEKFGEALEGAETEASDTGDAWSVLAESSVGRTGTLIPVQRRPSTGDWGLSLYADAWSPIFELMRRGSQVSTMQTDFGDLKFIFKDAADGGLVGARSAWPGAAGGDDGDKRQGGRRELELVNITDALTNRSYKGFMPPAGLEAEVLRTDVDAMQFITWLHFVREESFVQLKIAPALLGYTMGRTPMSGVALREENRVTAAQVDSAKEAAIKAIRKALITAAIIEGYTAAEVQAYADTLIIRWQTMFDDGELVSEEGDMTGESADDPQELDAPEIDDTGDDAESIE